MSLKCYSAGCATALSPQLLNKLQVVCSILSAFLQNILRRAAPDLGEAQGTQGPHHVHVFSHMCDMCVPLGRLLARKVFL